MFADRIGRRAFLKFMGLFLLLANGGRRGYCAQAAAARSRVVSVHNPRAVSGPGLHNADLDEKEVREMVARGVVALTGARDLKTAWRQIIPDPSRMVAIKINCQIQGIYTKAKVVWPIVHGVQMAGVPADRILIYDMTDTAFDLAGFRRNTGPGVKVGRVADFGGYSRFLYHRLANLLTGGHGYSGMNLLSGMLRASGGPFNCDYLINVPVLKALDGYCGVTLSMKNHYGSIGNPSEHHEDIMEHIPLVNSLSQIRGKTRLIVADAIFGQYRWTNGSNQQYVERVNKVLLSRDPVALDKVGWEMLESLRKEHGLAPVTPAPAYLARGAELGLGVADPARIELVNLAI